MHALSLKVPHFWLQLCDSRGRHIWRVGHNHVELRRGFKGAHVTEVQSEAVTHAEAATSTVSVAAHDVDAASQQCGSSPLCILRGELQRAGLNVDGSDACARQAREQRDGHGARADAHLQHPWRRQRV